MDDGGNGRGGGLRGGRRRGAPGRARGGSSRRGAEHNLTPARQRDGGSSFKRTKKGGPVSVQGIHDNSGSGAPQVQGKRRAASSNRGRAAVGRRGDRTRDEGRASGGAGGGVLAPRPSINIGAAERFIGQALADDYVVGPTYRAMLREKRDKRLAGKRAADTRSRSDDAPVAALEELGSSADAEDAVRAEATERAKTLWSGAAGTVFSNVGRAEASRAAAGRSEALLDDTFSDAPGVGIVEGVTRGTEDEGAPPRALSTHGGTRISAGVPRVAGRGSRHKRALTKQHQHVTSRLQEIRRTFLAKRAAARAVRFLERSRDARARKIAALRGLFVVNSRSSVVVHKIGVVGTALPARYEPHWLSVSSLVALSRAQPPGALSRRRCAHCTIPMHDGLLVFGGSPFAYDGSPAGTAADGAGFTGARTIDVYHVDPSTNSWTPASVTGTAAPQPQLQAFSATRVRFAGSEFACVIGGVPANGIVERTIDKVHTLDLKELRWHRRPVSGTAPCGRIGHSTVVVAADIGSGRAGDGASQSLVMFGGDAGGTRQNDTWALCFDATCEPPLRWSRWRTGGDGAPSPRMSHSSVVWAGAMLVFGGLAGPRSGDEGGAEIQPLNDLHSLDLVRRTWKTVRTVGPVPPARYGHTASIALRDAMVVAGGQPHAGAALRDVWVLALPSLSWSSVRVTGGPIAARAFHTCSLVRFGGLRMLCLLEGSGDSADGEGCAASTLLALPRDASEALALELARLTV